MIELSHRGLLVPNYNLPATLAELKEMFVVRRGSQHREQLFARYLTYLEKLTFVLGASPFKQWIDGSFTTNVQTPADIDLVSFVDYKMVEQHEADLAQFKYPVSLLYGVDAYVVKIYPADHRLYALYVGDRAYWMDRFDKTRRNNKGIVYPKGFLELSFPESTP